MVHQDAVKSTIDLINGLTDEQKYIVAGEFPALIGSKNSDIAVERKEITPGDALNILMTQNTLQMQRNDKDPRVQLYARLMSSNHWEPDSIIQFAHLGEEIYLVDGQNRLHAVVSSGKKQKFVCYNKEVKSAEELARYYTSIDHGATRSTQDDWKAISATKTKVILDAKQLARLAPAVSVLMSGFNTVSSRTRLQYSPLELQSVVRRFEKSGAQYYKIVTPIKAKGKVYEVPLGRRLVGSSIVAVALLTLEKSPELSTKFWTEIATGKFEENSVTSRVFDFIKNNRIDALNVGIFARVLANAWNLYYENNEKKLDQPLTAEGISHTDPIVILGTEFNGESTWVLNTKGAFVDASSVNTALKFNRPRKKKGVFQWGQFQAAQLAQKKPSAQSTKVMKAIEESEQTLEKIQEEVMEEQPASTAPNISMADQELATAG